MITVAAATLLLASTLASASPTPQKRSVSVIPVKGRQIANTDVFNATAVHRERAHIKAKYGNMSQRIARAKVAPPVKRSTIVAPIYDVNLHRRAGSGDGKSGKDPLKDEFDQIDEFYYGPLSIGTPAQDSSVDFDTGSSDLVLPLSTCSGCAGQLFDSTKSSTFKDTKEPFSIQYADKSGASGTIATDSVTVAGLTVADQAFGAVTKDVGGFSHGPNAGLLGLGFTDNAETKAKPFFINLAESGSLASNVFSFYMVRGGGDGSELCIGCTNSEKFSGDIDYYPLDPTATEGKQLYWNIASTGFGYEGVDGGDGGNGGGDGGNDGGNDGGDGGNGGDDGGDGSGDGGNDGGDGDDDGGDDGGDNATPERTRRADSGFAAVIDSGTTLIYAAPDVAQALYDKIPGAKPAGKDVGDGFFTFPCDAKLGTISIGFGSKQYAIDAKDFNLGPATQGSSDCVGGVIGEDIGGNLAIIGDEFMKNWYSVFDFDKKQVGFAQAK